MAKLAALLSVAALLGAAPVLRGDCDLKSTVKKAWCPTCAAYLSRADVKAGSCPKDKTRVQTRELCVKAMYTALCHPQKTGLTPVKCCGTTYDKPTDDESPVIYKCGECMESGSTVNVTHASTCVSRKAKKTCEKSGTAPHATFKLK